MTHSIHRTRRHKHPRHREAGIAMIVVMMILLVGTTIATMTVHTVNLETRSVGYYRQLAQTRYVAESAMAGFLALAPGTIKARLDLVNADLAAELAGGSVTPEPTPPDPLNGDLMQNWGEPDPARIPGVPKRVARFSKNRIDEALIGGGGVPVVREGDGESLGYQQAFMPWYVVDISDYYYEPAAVAGQDASGNSNMVFVRATVTVRSRLWLGDGLGGIEPNRGNSATVEGATFQQYTDSAYDMRAVVQLGPVPR